MSMAFVNFWLDLVALVAVGVVGWVSTMLQVVFPKPTLAAGWRLWGLDFNQWRDVQFGSICVCAVIILLHIMLHWNWVCAIVATKVLRLKVRPDEGAQTIYGVVSLAILLHLIAGGIIAALLTVQRPA
ncbi:MAG: hypothetical protein EHM42_13015 [Planctomycetaceae bacterium]|nr:MAG: hypothetical protein EHM42_13015 [Planctomycetaceae bacterium]